MKYVELIIRHQKEFEEFPIFFAFSNEQFKEGLEKLGATEEEVASLPFGGIIKKVDAKKYSELALRHNEELKKAMEDDDFVYSMFRYELSNHEYCVYEDHTETLEAVGLTYEGLDERMRGLLLKAEKDYIDLWKKDEVEI